MANVSYVNSVRLVKEFLPKNWQPPQENKRYIIVPLEDAKEIDRIMRKPPMSRRALRD